MQARNRQVATFGLAALLLAGAMPVAFGQGSTGLVVEKLPEVDVAIPGSPTGDTTPRATPLTIEPPRSREITVPDAPAVPPAVILAIPDNPPMPPRLSGTPDPDIATGKVDVAPPRPVIAIAPEKVLPAAPELPAGRIDGPPPRPIIAIAPEPPKAKTPVAAPVAATPLDRAALEAAFDTVWRSQPLPNPVMQGVKAYYEGAGTGSLWVGDGALNNRGRAVLATFDRGAEHGLDPARYGKLRQLIDTGEPAVREVATSVIAALYARDARGGRINPQQVSRLITATPTLPDTDDLLADLAKASDVGAALERYHPQHAGYQALRRELARLRTLPEETGMIAPEEPAPGRRRVKREAPNPVADVIANMERWRWLPAELGASHIFVNIPAYALTLKRAGAADLTTRVVVGKPQTQTPVFSDRMQFLVVNPYWNVPPSIALKEYLPLLQQNPYALQARGLEVISRGRVVDPATVNWSSIGRTVAIRQPPGERNALGHIKFMFPNQHAVYLHDTPSRGLFSRDVRAYSHGCVRVENPFRLAEAVLGGTWSEGRLRSMVGGPERQIGLDAHLPVHLAYFTTVVDETGTVKSYADIYGHNRRVRTLLGL